MLLKLLNSIGRKDKSLRDIFFNHDGKVADKWESYLRIYEEEFEKCRNTKGIILEVGVQNCGSLEIWAQYFARAKQIIGIDVLQEIEKLHFSDGRIETITCDAKEVSISPKLRNITPSVVVDDASHKSLDIIVTFLGLFPLLEEGGLYVIEDLCCSYWSKFNTPSGISSMDFFKGLVDLLNEEHRTTAQGDIAKYILDVTGSKATFARDYEKMIGTIRSVKFYNSMCFIQKCSTDEASLIGARIVRGSEAPLGFRAPNGQDIADIRGS